jgi:hypothetical protein
MNNKEKLQGLSAEDREIQMLMSTKQKEHSGLTGLKVKFPRPCLPTGRHRTGLPGDVDTIAGSALTPLRESVTALPAYLPTAGRQGGASSRLAREGFQVRKNQALISRNCNVDKGE